jgi:serine/threonine protein kinase
MPIEWSELEVGEKLGSGTFGTVYAVVDHVNQRTCAMKVLNKHHVKMKKQEKRVVSETKLLLSLQSSFICACYGANENAEAYFLLMEKLDGGELKRLIYPQGFYIYK